MDFDGYRLVCWLFQGPGSSKATWQVAVEATERLVQAMEVDLGQYLAELYIEASMLQGEVSGHASSVESA